MQKSIRIMALCLAAVMGMGLGILGQSRAEAAEPVYAGIDISRYQGTVDFDRVAADGIDIVYMRAGEGNDYIDPEYERNYQQAREAGLKSGAYLYVTATTVDEGREQAKFFASLLQGKEFACRPVMDFENLRGLNRQTANDIALAFLQTLEEETGVTPAIYTGAYKVEAVWDADLAAYPLWIAEYGAEEPKTTGAWKEWSGFALGLGATPYQAPESAAYIGEGTIGAVVLSYDPRQGRAAIEQRNKFALGDTLSILSPGDVGRTLRVEGLWDLDGAPRQDTPHPRERLLLACHTPLQAGDILRILPKA